jgi:putative transposase
MAKYKFQSDQGMHFVTLTVVDWLDVFTRPEYKKMIVENLVFCQKEKGLLIYGFVIMTNHIHLILAANGAHTLEKIVLDFKSYTGKQMLKAIAENPQESRKEWLLAKFSYNARINKGDRELQFWQADNHPIELWSLPVIRQKLDYVHNNPVEEEWVLKPEHYIFSSASNYANGEGVLEVLLLDLPMSMVGYIYPTRL